MVVQKSGGSWLDGAEEGGEGGEGEGRLEGKSRAQLTSR